MFKTQKKSLIKRKGRWDKNKWKTVGETFRCPKCNNQNAEPLRKEDHTPYCSNCLVKYGELIVMLKRNIQRKKSKNEIKSRKTKLLPKSK
ncbi:hypothetical protein YDYSY3_39080 [Paenibacillus chitinolyticus]|uniref:hypothetical protein n=1 Tax=Paenibacillus chitinolyticus TaxID=79263 RepID=UPI0026E4A157|nr:hypothetical protein [Paenibacillus chitinolyticus]GKS12908.1 hypothetical protein YDYSY3_39080 [Paenibacillus chitinolyticus]